MNKEKKIEEIFCSLVDYIPKLSKGIENIIKSIHGGDETKFLDMFVNAIEGMEWSIAAMHITKEIHNYNDYDNINLVLKELLGAFESQDYTLIADLFEYEILPEINKWQMSIDK